MDITSMNKEMTKLVSMLAKADISFSIFGMRRTNYYTDDEYIAFNIVVPNQGDGRKYSGSIDAASSHSSYGGRDGLIEIMGAQSCENITNNDVIGYLTAEKAFEYIMKAWEIINK